MSKRDNSGINHTCPRIDEVISAVKSQDWGDSYWAEKDVIEILEEIRRMNAELRDWGNDRYYEAEEYKDFEGKYDDAVSENRELKDEVKALTNEVNDKDEMIYDLQQELKAMKCAVANVL
jgi:predicted  nucleic acid-binding Zn-ribbon protein